MKTKAVVSIRCPNGIKVLMMKMDRKKKEE